MSTKHHCCIDISGALKNLKSFRGAVTDNDGRPMTLLEFKAYLLNEQAKGHSVIPICDCDNFDYQHGCQGHEEEDTAQEVRG